MQAGSLRDDCYLNNSHNAYFIWINAIEYPPMSTIAYESNINNPKPI